MKPNLIFIDLNYGFLPAKITQLITQEFQLSEIIKVFLKTKNSLKKIFSEVRVSIHQKLRNVVGKNYGLEIMMKIFLILTGDSKSIDGLPEDLTGIHLKFYKYASMTSN